MSCFQTLGHRPSGERLVGEVIELARMGTMIGPLVSAVIRDLLAGVSVATRALEPILAGGDELLRILCPFEAFSCNPKCRKCTLVLLIAPLQPPRQIRPGRWPDKGLRKGVTGPADTLYEDPE
ncbi:hypothetical protein CGLO_06479 [Colletotrichum gloeosporioides Cg-14]|uniref:Uncharacterized protein n=1 Tax=Colletotrichum gloeosporioides (strain Cg-14) TaxID=1237896 RepID=T0KE87_COLGC|nr:hypothetical protein CGLO_06479 [Colletotrichum gloeosporioides Cg-14]